MDFRTELQLANLSLLPTWERLGEAELRRRLSTPTDSDLLTFIFVHDEVEVPCRLLTRAGADRLLVFFNGSVDRARSSSGIVFQRSSWENDFDTHCLWIADPTIARSPEIGIGWGQLNSTDFLPFTVKQLVDAADSALNDDSPLRRLYFGSSAGGFQALACASLDPGSKAVVNNPQTHWPLYPDKRAVALVMSGVLGCSTTEQMCNKFAWRCDLRRLFECAGNAPKVEYYVNFGSRFDVDDHFRPLREWYQAQDSLIAERFVSRSYRDGTTGRLAHNPMNREKTVTAINRVLRSLD